jgi:hypothetical protein
MPIHDVTPPVGWRRCLIIVACWCLLWAAVPALFVWANKPYYRYTIFPLAHSEDARWLPGEMSSTADLVYWPHTWVNNRYALEYLIIGAAVGLTGGLVAVRLRRTFQVLLLSMACGMVVIAIFDIRNGPPFFDLPSAFANLASMCRSLLAVLFLLVALPVLSSVAVWRWFKKSL